MEGGGGLRALCASGGVGREGRPDSFPRTVRATGTKIGVSIDHGTGFNPMLFSRIPFHRYAPEHVHKPQGTRGAKWQTTQEWIRLWYFANYEQLPTDLAKTHTKDVPWHYLTSVKGIFDLGVKGQGQITKNAFFRARSALDYSFTDRLG